MSAGRRIGVSACRRIGVVGLRSCCDRRCAFIGREQAKGAQRRIKSCSGVISINLIDLCTSNERATPVAQERNPTTPTRRYADTFLSNADPPTRRPADTFLPRRVTTFRAANIKSLTFLR